MQISFFDGTQQYKIRKPIRLIELFAGIGSQAKALKNIGVDFEHYKICEFDKYAVTSYNAIHGTNFTTSDITKLSALDLGIVDTDKYEYIMTYSFPCTDLSKAGAIKGMNKGSGTRSSLLWEVERLLDECNELPQVLLMENVPQVLSDKNIEIFNLWRKKLKLLGYSNFYQCLNAKDYGVPQSRNRCFMISLLGEFGFAFPSKIKLNKTLVDYLEKNVNKKYYISKYRFDSLKFEKPSRKVLDNAPKVIGGIGEKKSNGGVQWYQQNRVYDSKIAISVTTSFNPYYLIHDENGDIIRKLSPLECFKLMGFDKDDFEKAVSVGIRETQLYKQAGNSIVVNVLEAIFKQLF